MDKLYSSLTDFEKYLQDKSIYYTSYYPYDGESLEIVRGCIGRVESMKSIIRIEENYQKRCKICKFWEGREKCD